MLTGADAANAAHADLDASYEFHCAQPGRLAQLEILLFAGFPRIERIEVQAALPSGQSHTTLDRAQSRRAVRLSR